MLFLSHLLIAGWDTGPNFHLSVRSFVNNSRRSLFFSASVIAASVKPCIVTVLTYPSSMHLDQVSLTYISRSTDFVNFYDKVWLIFMSKFGFLCISDTFVAATVKPCIVFDLDYVPLTYISWSIDFLNFYVEVWFSFHQR